jgi:outer membrane protein assembly factor BamE (lipoprotein component of BamABCDE complex)|tara:strand:+ start:47 stop:466 length:420 start_codon:yes stop_codon:yes gene_type:complete
MKKTLLILTAALLITNCTAQHHRGQLEDKNNKLTLGNVQKNIKEGMSGAEVARVMGSPNVVTKDGDNSEVWIYDKISTTASASNSSLFGLGGRIGGTTGVGGLGTYGSGASSQNQKTLTVIIKFENQKVTKVDYNASSF